MLSAGKFGEFIACNLFFTLRLSQDVLMEGFALMRMDKFLLSLFKFHFSLLPCFA